MVLHRIRSVKHCGVDHCQVIGNDRRLRRDDATLIGIIRECGPLTNSIQYRCIPVVYRVAQPDVELELGGTSEVVARVQFQRLQSIDQCHLDCESSA